MQPDPDDARSSATGAATLRELRFRPAGDTALDFIIGDRMDQTVSGAVLALATRFAAAGIAGVVEVVPAFAVLTVHFDPLVVGYDEIVGHVRELQNAPLVQSASGRVWQVPVCYEGVAAPDLDEVAARTGFTRAEVIARHGAPTYHVYLLGFLPGFPYMGDLDTGLCLPRRNTPRVTVPAGSVAIANAMTAVYPLESPGGWHIIGRTPVRLFDPSRPSPSLLAPGDAVRFVAIDSGELERLNKLAASGDWRLDPQSGLPPRLDTAGRSP